MSRKDTITAIMSMLHTLPPLPTDSCIFKVPYTLRRVNPEAYKPWRLSVGPFHHGKENLPEMEVHKQRYLKDFLERKPELNLEDYVRTLEEMEESVRNCYAENINCTSSDFVKMMLLDACFIIELFIKVLNHGLRSKDDPIFMSDIIFNELYRDILLLENQLPFFVFEYLFILHVEAQFREGYSFLDLTVDVLILLGGHHEELNSLRKSNCQVKHFVDLYLQCYTPTATKSVLKPAGEFVTIPSATRLNAAGVQFRKSTTTAENCFLDVKFHDGIFEITTLILDDGTETLFRNLIAFEQCNSSRNTQYMSDYIFLMDCVIDSPKDVALLKEAGIIDNYLGDNTEVSQMVNRLGSGVVGGNQGVYYDRLCNDVNDYCSKRWPVWRAKLRRDYLDSPCAVISIVAAIILLLFAFLQTICSVIQL